MSINKVLLVAFAAAALAAFAGLASAGERLSGVWLTGDGSTRVAFKSCGGADCGQIVWLREPTDPETGRAWLDKFNSDDALRRRPLIGLTIVTGLQAKGPGRWAGALYNPLDGNSYSGNFRMLDPQKLELKGCALAGLLCQSEIWLRVN